MKLSSICANFGWSYEGEDRKIDGLQTLENADEKHLVFFDNEKLIDKLKATKAGVVIISSKFREFAPKRCSLIISENPHLSIAYLSGLFASKLINSTSKPPQIDKSAVIMPNAYIGNGAVIKANVIIMAGAYIGENVTIDCSPQRRHLQQLRYRQKMPSAR